MRTDNGKPGWRARDNEPLTICKVIGFGSVISWADYRGAEFLNGWAILTEKRDDTGCSTNCGIGGFMKLTEWMVFHDAGCHFGVGRLDILLTVFRDKKETGLIWDVRKGDVVF